MWGFSPCWSPATCGELRPLGFVARFEPGSMTVADVEPLSIAAGAGLRSGDRIVRANGQIVEGRMDWQRVRVNVDPAVPLDLLVERAGARWTFGCRSARIATSRAGPRPALIVFRLAQVITLGLAILVAVRRRSQPSALLGALLLASIATISFVLPMRMAVFWRVVSACRWACCCGQPLR